MKCRYCDKEAQAQGLCMSHYSKWYRKQIKKSNSKYIGDKISFPRGWSKMGQSDKVKFIENTKRASHLAAISKKDPLYINRSMAQNKLQKMGIKVPLVKSLKCAYPNCPNKPHTAEYCRHHYLEVIKKKAPRGSKIDRQLKHRFNGIVIKIANLYHEVSKVLLSYPNKSLLHSFTDIQAGLAFIRSSGFVIDNTDNLNNMAMKNIMNNDTTKSVEVKITVTLKGKRKVFNGTLINSRDSSLIVIEGTTKSVFYLHRSLFGEMLPTICKAKNIKDDSFYEIKIEKI